MKNYKKEERTYNSQFCLSQETENSSTEAKETERITPLLLQVNWVNMALVHGDSQECTKSELGLFTTPTTQTYISKGSWMEYHPLSNMTESGPIEFYVSGSDEEYLDLARTHLFVKAKIVKADGTDLEATTQVEPTNLFLHSVFSQVDVSLNERLISSSTSTHAYRAMLETLLNYGDEAKKSQLTMSLF